MTSRVKTYTFLLISAMAMLAGGCRSKKEITNSTTTKNTEASAEKNNAELKNKKLQSKYAEMIGVSEDEINNIMLYAFIDEWYGSPYRYGGKDKSGIDCSNFTSTLYKHVYNLPVTGSSGGIFQQCSVISKADLKEGDLVFFKIEQNNISHIGIYLQNNKFVHATTKKGVMIDDLNEAYYKKYFYKAGRHKSLK
jgi:lipoprotein Spr